MPLKTRIFDRNIREGVSFVCFRTVQIKKLHSPQKMFFLLTLGRFIVRSSGQPTVHEHIPIYDIDMIKCIPFSMIFYLMKTLNLICKGDSSIVSDCKIIILFGQFLCFMISLDSTCGLLPVRCLFIFLIALMASIFVLNFMRAVGASLSGAGYVVSTMFSQQLKCKQKTKIKKNHFCESEYISIGVF